MFFFKICFLVNLFVKDILGMVRISKLNREDMFNINFDFYESFNNIWVRDFVINRKGDRIITVEFSSVIIYILSIFRYGNKVNFVYRN